MHLITVLVTFKVGEFKKLTEYKTKGIVKVDY